MTNDYFDRWSNDRMVDIDQKDKWHHPVNEFRMSIDSMDNNNDNNQYHNRYIEWILAWDKQNLEEEKEIEEMFQWKKWNKGEPLFQIPFISTNPAQTVLSVLVDVKLVVVIFLIRVQYVKHCHDRTIRM